MRRVLLQLTASETVETLVIDGERLLVEVRWQAAHHRPPRHFHPDHDERFEVREGRVAAVLNGDERVYGVGDSFEAPRGTVHAMWPHGGPAVATWECRPGDRALALFEDLDRLTRRGLRGPALAVARGAVVGRHQDVMRLAVGPQPVVRAVLRALSRFA